MTPEQVLEKMLEIYGGEENLANPEHYPRVFKSQVEMAKWILGLPKPIQEVQEQQEKSSLDPKPEV